jgi:hypothetical protein
LRISFRLRLVHCRECGAVVGTQRAVQKVLSELLAPLGLPAEKMDWLGLCLSCKRTQALRQGVLVVEAKT